MAGLRQAAIWLGLLLVLPPAAFATGVTVDDLAGHWFGEGAQGDLWVQYLIERKADGTFKTQFQVFKDCVFTQVHIDAGTWTLSGDLYGTATSKRNVEDVSYQSTYVIRGFTGTTLEYSWIEGGLTFQQRRVADPARFAFPPVVCRPAR